MHVGADECVRPYVILVRGEHGLACTFLLRFRQRRGDVVEGR
jgi:hypothetical protein